MISELGKQLRQGKISCIELVQQTVVALKHDKTNSIITLTEEEALARAVELDREFAAGIDRGPLHGIVTAHKDLFYTRGVRTTGGSLVYRDFVPDHDATVVERLKVAGAISVAKTNQHEIAYGITSKNPHFGFVLNPHDASRIPGGSSGGSGALVGAQVLPTSLGTDTGGSIRIPASYCGAVGLKPTYGRVSRFGVLPLAYSLDHVGPLSASVEDCALTMNAIAGPDPNDETCLRLAAPDFNRPALEDLSGICVGVPANFFTDGIDGEVDRAVGKAIAEMQRMGARVETVRVPDMAEVNVVAQIIQLSEVASVYTNHRDSSLFGEDVWALIEMGRGIAAHEYVSAQRLRTIFRREFDRLWHKVDLLAVPTTPITAPKIDESTITVCGQQEDARMASTRLVRGMNLLGDPALSMPCGWTEAGLPIGLQLISPPFTEPQLLQIARTIEPAISVART